LIDSLKFVTPAVRRLEVLGGIGNDSLDGGGGRNLLVGGSGVDALVGGATEHVLIGGQLAYLIESSGTLDLIAIANLVVEWTQTDVGYAHRINHLTGTVFGGLNGSSVINATTVSDDVAVDSLRGGNALDWFLANVSRGVSDVVVDRIALETLTDIP
jgi:Ca2+-binding RTX toxin-like protein